MINNYYVNNNTLCWEVGENKIVKQYEKINAVICNETELLVYCIACGIESVILLSHDGTQLAQMSATDELYIMYLQKHPRFGLCAVCSSREKQDEVERRILFL